jgi:S-adenosylmethionine decarboxylase
MKRLGTHLIIDMEGCNPEKLDNLEFLEKIMTEAAEICGATVLKTGFQKFSPIGVSGVVIIAESHLAGHFWPEFGHSSLDIYTCGTRVDPYKALNYLLENLECKEHRIQELARSTVAADEDS